MKTKQVRYPSSLKLIKKYYVFCYNFNILFTTTHHEGLSSCDEMETIVASNIYKKFFVEFTVN